MKFSSSSLPVLAATAALLSSYTVSEVSAHSHSRPLHRRHALLNEPAHGRMVRRQVKLDENASTTAPVVGADTIGSIIAHRNLTTNATNTGGSPYNIAAALANWQHSSNVMITKNNDHKKQHQEKRGDDKVSSTSTSGDDDEDCKEEDEGEDADEEECEEDDGTDDAEGDEDCDEEEGSDTDLPNFTAKPAEGSSSTTTTPSDLAEGSMTAEKGCTAFAKAVSGDTCYKLLSDRSLLSEFYKANPAVHNDCKNLQIGVSYCIGFGGTASSSGNDASSATPAKEDKPASTPIQADVSVEVKPTKQEEEQQPAQSTPAPVKEEPKTEPVKEQPKPQETQPSSGGGAKKDYTGHATYYYQHGNAGACGKKNPDSAYIVALHPSLYNGGARCGKGISLTNTKTGKTLQATVADLCPSCEGSGHVDLSDGLFKALGNGADGVFDIAFGFN